MVKLDTFARKAAFALAAGQTLPDGVDAKKIQVIGQALAELYAPGNPARERMFADLATGQDWNVQTYVSAIDHRVNHTVDGKPKKDRISVTGADLIRAAPYAETYQKLKGLHQKEKSALEGAFASNDLPALQQHLEALGIHVKPGWAARLYRNVPVRKREDGTIVVQHTIQGAGIDSYAIRGETIPQMRQMAADIEGLVISIAKSQDGAERAALRDQVAEMFAALVNVAALASRGERYDSGVNLKGLFERLAVAGVPGFLPERGQIEFPALGQTFKTKLDIRNPALQMTAVPLQLETRGLDENRYIPGEQKPAITLAEDRVHLGTPDRPVGFVRDGFAIIPASFDVVMMEQPPPGLSWATEKQLGFNDLPEGPVRFQSRPFGVALKVPVQVSVGEHALELRGGRYVVTKGDPEAVDVSVSQGHVRIDAGGRVRTIDTKTGAIS